jgi:benzoyl-CoA reductase subunit D
MPITAGIDVGTGLIKVVLLKVEGDKVEELGKATHKIRQRDPYKLTEEAYDGLLKEAGKARADVDYCATTGEGESIPFHTGHFYSMTTHARGAVYLDPESRAALDIGALHGRVIRTDERGKVLDYKMTSQCASGSGQFLENIARYLGVAQDEIGSLSLKSDEPEIVSGICAVLAETDVINMVSRNISSANILKGIHISMADRLSKLLKQTGVSDGIVMATGGLALDVGLIATLNEMMAKLGLKIEVRTHPESIYAGALGAALWGAFRYKKLVELGHLDKAS